GTRSPSAGTRPPADHPRDRPAAARPAGRRRRARAGAVGGTPRTPAESGYAEGTTARGRARQRRPSAGRVTSSEWRDMADLDVPRADAVLVGGGIASATLAAMLTELEPSWKIVVLERLHTLGAESSDGWNNAGTGHSALCELNYTPQDVDGSV